MIRFPVQPRLIPLEKVARRLGVTQAVFADKLADLEKAGFPKPDPILGNYCLEAVDKWIDSRAGLTPAGAAVSDPNQVLDLVRKKAWAK